MSPSRKRWMAVGLVIVAAVAVEVGGRLARRARTNLVLVNGGQTAVHDLVATYGRVELVLGDLAPGESVVARLEKAPDQDVTFAFEQEGNPTPELVVDGGELDGNRAAGMRMVLTLNPLQVVRYSEVDPDVDDGPVTRLFRRARAAVFDDPSQPGLSRLYQQVTR